MFDMNLTTRKQADAFTLRGILRSHWQPGLFKKVSDRKDDGGDRKAQETSGLKKTLRPCWMLGWLNRQKRPHRPARPSG